MIQIKAPVQKSFERIKREAVKTNNVLRMSASDLKENNIVNHCQPMDHLKKLREAGWINFVVNKIGNRNPLVITILKV